MEIVAISIVAIILVTAIIGPPGPHEGPSFIITPIQTHTNREPNNAGCLIVAVMAIIFFIAVASSSM